MRLTFANSGTVVVTAGAGVAGVAVAKRQDKLSPAGARNMAGSAIVCGQWMRLRSSGCKVAVMATCTYICGVVVVKRQYKLLPAAAYVTGIDVASIAHISGGRV